MHYTRSTVGNVEVGRQNAPLDFWTRCDQILNAGGALREGYDAICRLLAAHHQEQARKAAVPALTTTSPDEDAVASAEAYRSGSKEGRRAQLRGARHDPEDVVRRRILIQHALTTLAAGAALPALDVIRSGLVSAVTGQDPADADVAEWEQVAHEYGLAYFSQSPSELIANLAADLADLQSSLDIAPDQTHQDLSRVSGLLAGVMAMSLTNLGQFQPARRWWRAARKAADASGDPHVRSWVYGHDATHGLYDRRPLAAALARANEAIAAGEGAGCPGTAEALGARAQTLALLGRADEATAAVRQLADMFEHLPDRTTEDLATIYGYPQHRMWHTTSYVHTHLSDTPDRNKRTRELAAARTAQDHALGLYPPTWRRARAQVELHAARCLVHDRQLDDGAYHAQKVIDVLPAEHRTAMVLGMAQKVIDVVPAQERRRTSVVGLRERLTLRAGPVDA